MVKLSRIFTLTMLTSLLLMSFLTLVVNAQSQGTAVIVPSVGGTTAPDAGTYNYADGTTQQFTATPDTGFIFSSWTISTSSGSSISSDNPLSLPMIAGVTYEIQANFDPLQAIPGVPNIPSNMANAAIVVLLSSAGGTVSPAPGTYAFDDASSFNISATANSGWTFSHWVISGPLDNHGGFPFTPTPTDNPYNINHGYGATYTYQAVFNPVGASPGPSPTIPEFSGLFVVVIAVVLVAIALGTFAVKRRK
jgi:hypothetical protein